MRLSDGGVSDHLGLETAFKRYQTVRVSDGGGKLSAEEEPKEDWARHAYRILSLIDNQVRGLRTRLSDEQQARLSNWATRSATQRASLEAPPALSTRFPDPHVGV